MDVLCWTHIGCKVPLLARLYRKLPQVTSIGGLNNGSEYHRCIIVKEDTSIIRPCSCKKRNEKKQKESKNHLPHFKRGPGGHLRPAKIDLPQWR